MQDHGNPVAYRNIWVRELPSRRNRPVPEVLRSELAEKTLRLASETDDLAAKLVWLWESYCYKADDKVRPQIEACSAAYVERLKKMSRPLTGEQREEIRNMAQFVGMGIRNHLFKRDDPLAQTILQMKDL